jgi:4-carboxymuconolactone decarboxylase
MSLSRREVIGTGVALASLRAEAAATDAGSALVNPPTARACTDRMPEIPAVRQTEAQKKASAEFYAGRKVAVFGPFVPLLRSPEVMLRAKAMGDYLRYQSSLPPKLNELTILLTARAWTQNVEWAIHQPIALKAGLAPELVAAVAEGRRPPKLDADEQLVLDFVNELLHNQAVSDFTYAAAVRRFGEQGVIDLTSVCGYYTFLAMVLNVARTPPSAHAPTLSPFICG